MKITSDQWADYINKLSTLNSRGSKLVQDWIDKHGTEDVDALIDYCYKVIARYGTASAELTASMYEAIAQAEKVLYSRQSLQTSQAMEMQRRPCRVPCFSHRVASW